MKTLNITFEDQEIEALEKVKGEKSWHDLIMMLVNIKVRKT